VCLPRAVPLSVLTKSSFSKKAIWASKDETEIVMKKLESGIHLVDKARGCIDPAERILMNVRPP